MTKQSQQDIYDRILSREGLELPLEEYETETLIANEQEWTDLVEEVYLDLVDRYGADGARELI